jgi:hypothetical protein
MIDEPECIGSVKIQIKGDISFHYYKDSSMKIQAKDLEMKYKFFPNEKWEKKYKEEWDSSVPPCTPSIETMLTDVVSQIFESISTDGSDYN